MTQTLFDITYNVAKELGIVVEGTVTNGTTTTTIDTLLLKDRYEDNYFNSGTYWHLYDLYSSGGPTNQGEWARITDFVKNTGTIVRSALSSAADIGDRYAIANPEYTLDTMIMNINSALREIQIPIIDISTVVTDEDKTEYTLPDGVLDQSITVWMQRSTTTDNNLWIEYFDWYVAETETGVYKKLIFRTLPPEPYAVKIEYWQPHPALYLSYDKLAETISIDRIAVDGALKCLLWKNAQKSQVDPQLALRIQELMARSSRLHSRFPVPRPGPKLATYGHTNNFD